LLIQQNIYFLMKLKFALYLCHTQEYICFSFYPVSIHNELKNQHILWLYWNIIYWTNSILYTLRKI
jgi:hypothetical protein